MEEYITEISYDKNISLFDYDASFRNELYEIENRYKSFFKGKFMKDYVRTSFDFIHCQIKLKPFPEELPENIAKEIIDAINNVYGIALPH